MKLAYRDMEHILSCDGGYINELVIENKGMFRNAVNSMVMQSEGLSGDWVLSVADRPVELSKYTDLTIEFAPFRVNRKSLLNKLYAAMERQSVNPENYTRTTEILCELERYIFSLAEEFPFEINCNKLTMGPIIRALSPEIDEADKSPLEKIFAYMELVRELDRDKLFIMVNMRSYFSDEDMQEFVNSSCLHDFRVLLLSNISEARLNHTKRYIVDVDLCEL